MRESPSMSQSKTKYLSPENVANAKSHGNVDVVAEKTFEILKDGKVVTVEVDRFVVTGEEDFST